MWYLWKAMSVLGQNFVRLKLPCFWLFNSPCFIKYGKMSFICLFGKHRLSACSVLGRIYVRVSRDCVCDGAKEKGSEKFYFFFSLTIYKSNIYLFWKFYRKV
jgi:hypothetical protein